MVVRKLLFLHNSSLSLTQWITVIHEVLRLLNALWTPAKDLENQKAKSDFTK